MIILIDIGFVDERDLKYWIILTLFIFIMWSVKICNDSYISGISKEVQSKWRNR